MEEPTTNAGFLLESWYWFVEYLEMLVTWLWMWLDEPELFGVPFGKYLLLLAVAAGLLFLLAWGWRCLALRWVCLVTRKGRVARIVSHVDGDTVRVNAADGSNSPVALRLIGVDTPESRRSMYMHIAPFGAEASSFTKKYLPKGRKVFLVYDVETKDQFGRELVYLYLPNGELYNKTLLKRGYAWAATYPPNVKFDKQFRRLEQRAQRRKRAIWQIYADAKTLREDYKQTAEYKEFMRKHGNFKQGKKAKSQAQDSLQDRRK